MRNVSAKGVSASSYFARLCSRWPCSRRITLKIDEGVMNEAESRRKQLICRPKERLVCVIAAHHFVTTIIVLIYTSKLVTIIFVMAGS